MTELDTNGISAAELLDCLVRQWETAVATQQHFNTLEWRIRGLALAAMTAVLTVAFSDYASQVSFTLLGKERPGFTVLLLIGAGLWYIFYFADYHWYHPLLKGASQTASDLEEKISVLIEGSGIEIRSPGTLELSNNITRSSHTTWFFRQRTSSHKIRIFYGLGLIPVLGGALFGWFSV